MKGPLTGIRVLELARILAGPWAGQILADLGADVIKVERPKVGDDTRGWGPPFVEGANGENLSAAYYHSCNRGKRSIAVDLETESGQRVVRKLAQRSDVVIENFKVGGLKKFGLDYKSLGTENPRLIYCSITGFGQDGPYAARAGYDLMIQGMGGIMSITGEPSSPMRLGVAFADVFTGVYSALAVQSALVQRATTGKGCYIDMALLDTQVGVLANQALFYLASGKVPDRLGNAHATIVPYQVFPVADGFIIIACGNDSQFIRLATSLGEQSLADDPDFKTNAGRVTHRDRLISRMLLLTAKFTRDELLKKLEVAGVPAGPINNLADVFADPQVKHRKMTDNLPGSVPKVSGIRGVRTPIMIDGWAAYAERPSPAIGEHSEEILREIGEA